MERQMVRISVRVRSEAASFRVGIQALSIGEALALAGSWYPHGEVRVVFPIEPKVFFVREPSALVGAAGSKQAREGAA